MATTYEHKILNVRVLQVSGDLQDVVYEIDWQLEASDGLFVAFYSNTSKVAAPEPEAFIPFEDLTEDDVKAWLPDPLTDDMKRYLDDRLWSQNVASQAVAKPLPWSQPDQMYVAAAGGDSQVDM